MQISQNVQRGEKYAVQDSRHERHRWQVQCFSTSLIWLTQNYTACYRCY